METILTLRSLRDLKKVRHIFPANPAKFPARRLSESDRATLALIREANHRITGDRP